ncbi:peptidylprolyl isomerase FKBP-type [Melioribacter roseus P3M-2]|uniref:Peptidyl-prolyl cis-trans isomerase n=1 Tax=Melioribacter roseus (strain DSM 23840 / JCM 17771 / VKM B-2668 / P3M-2) TaxID=1191523 RepID=I6ZQM0_MELRP|nr:FKBP-type peptidyl-prolyl cis-trans isomerase [Melioribacter roseus]AFN74369.1 peptidylprolyl isomerase FKBP-type [Melioribacter roseus P3M-2]
MSIAKTGDKVKVHYTGTLNDGTQFDSSHGNEPLEFTIGEGALLGKFENAVVGLEPGQSVDINIPADEAYGQRREDLIIKVNNSNLPPNLNPEVGMKLHMQTADNQVIPLTIVEVLEDGIMVDANHELAGQDLNFHIELVSIEE